MDKEQTQQWAAEHELSRIRKHALPLMERWRAEVGGGDENADLGLVLQWAAEQLATLEKSKKKKSS